jgi:hypothetical protein
MEDKFQKTVTWVSFSVLWQNGRLDGKEGWAAS